MYVNTWKLSEDSLQMSYLDYLVLYKPSSALRRGHSVGSNIFYLLIFWREKNTSDFLFLLAEMWEKSKYETSPKFSNCNEIYIWKFSHFLQGKK